MRINKFISYILCNKGIIVNLHKLHFPSFPFFSPTKQKSFLSSHFSTPPTKHIRGKITIFSILSLFHLLTIFHPPTFPLLHPNGVWTPFSFSSLFSISPPHLSSQPFQLPPKKKKFQFKILYCKEVIIKLDKTLNLFKN